METTQNYVQWVVSQYQQLDFYLWGIMYQGTLIGEISVVEKIDDYGICGIGYVLSKKYWQKGFMSEACHKIMAYLFREIGYRKIVASCDAINVGSSKVLEKANMTLEGVFREHIVRKDGTFGDSKQYGILESEFSNHFH